MRGPELNFKEILELIDKVADRGIASVEVERAGTKVRIEGKQSQPQVIHSYVTEGKHEAAGGPAPMPSPSPATASAPAPAPEPAPAGDRDRRRRP